MKALASRVILASGWQRALIGFAAGAAGALAMPPFGILPALAVSLTVAVWLVDGVRQEDEPDVLWERLAEGAVGTAVYGLIGIGLVLLGFKAFDTAAGRIGTLVCWDQWYPEAARLTALAGADVLFYPTAIGWHPAEKAETGAAQVSAWQTMQRAHAIANGVYVAAVNRVGHEGPAGGGLEFWGASFVCDPFGVVVAEASPSAEEVLVADVDLARQEDVRRNWPFLRDRRIDAYAPITKRLLVG